MKYGVLLGEDLKVKDFVEGNKTVFGISNYSSSFSDRDVRELSQNIKDELKNIQKNIRFILPKKPESALSSGQINRGKLLKKGFELVILDQGMGKTLEIQDIDAFRKRDYNKPFVDTQMGVIPPKLARIMNNLVETNIGGTIWGPFCGSGNILLEALDLGYNVIGTDIDSESLEGSKRNVEWFKDGQLSAQISFFDVLNPIKSKKELLKQY